MSQKQPQDWREARRLRAWELKQKGWKAIRIAEALGVTRGAVSQWFKQAEAQGKEALYGRKHPGPKPRLSQAQLDQLPVLLSRGAEAYGFRGEVWTCNAWPRRSNRSLASRIRRNTWVTSCVGSGGVARSR